VSKAAQERFNRKMPIFDGEPFEWNQGFRGMHRVVRRMRWTARMSQQQCFGVWLQEHNAAEGRWTKCPDNIHSMNPLLFTELVRFMAALAPRLAELELGEGGLPGDLEYHRWRTSPETREMLDDRRDTKGADGEPGRGPSGG
jgi:hypothetical protein